MGSGVSGLETPLVEIRIECKGCTGSEVIAELVTHTCIFLYLQLSMCAILPVIWDISV